jgi:hypothetical protein
VRVFLWKLLPTEKLAKTPYEARYGKKPDLSHQRVFGSEVWVHVPKETNKKMDDKAIKGVFVGYGNTSSLYRVALGDKVKIFRDVKFNEIDPTKSDEYIAPEIGI